MKRYEFIFVKEDNTKLQGPIFGEDQLERFAEIARDIHKMDILRLTFNSTRHYIPKEVLHAGHIVIRRIGFLRSVWKAFRHR